MQVIQENKKIPGPKGKPIVGDLTNFKNDRLGYLKSLRDYGDIVRTKLANRELIFLFNPDDIKYVLATNHANYHKAKQYKHIKAVLGQGLVTTEDEVWRRHRQIIQPVFHSNQLKDYIAEFNNITKEFIQSWDQKGILNNFSEMSALTANIVTKTILGSDIELDANLICEAVSFLILHIQKQAQALVNIPHSIPTGENRGYNKNMKFINTIVDKMIEKHKQSTNKSNDIMSRLMMVTGSDTEQPLSDSELRDEIRTFFLAGHETSATALTWTLYLLARNKHVTQKMIEEIHSVLGKDRDPIFDDLQDLKYVEQVINETIRLYPPIYFFSRTPLKEDNIRGYPIPVGSSVVACQWVTHRDPALWDEPDIFKPERMEEEKLKSMHKYAFFPFGGGPRTCIGKHFAVMEMKIILAKIFQSHYVELQIDEGIKAEPYFTLRPEKEINLIFKKQAN